MDWVTGHLPPAGHNHAGCVLAVLAAAERCCADRRLRLTAQRRRVLEIVAGRHQAIGAYEILATLGRDGRTPAPISVYRALDFLVAHGLVHRLATQNAFIACSRPSAPHRPQLLVCDRCRTIAEIDDPVLAQAIDGGARAAGFRVTARAVEISGLCAVCVAADAAAASPSPSPSPSAVVVTAAQPPKG